MITAAAALAQLPAPSAGAQFVFGKAPAYPSDRTPMKLPDIYTDWRIMGGLALIVLGSVNWAIGLSRTQEYSRIIASHPDVAADQAYRSFDELDPHSDIAVLAPFTDEQRRVSYATARMDFYHVTFLTGRAIVLAGVVLTLVGFIALIQSDSHRAHRRLGAHLGAHGPPEP